RGAEEHDRREILLDVERQVLVEAGIYHERRAEAPQERVAVGLCVRGDFGRDVSGGAGAVVDDDLLPKELRELRRDDASERVRAAARRVRDEETDRSRRIVLRNGR